MNAPFSPPSPFDLCRRAEIYSILDQVCRDLEPTETQLDRLRSAYESVGDWIAGSADPLLSSTKVYLHGSVATGTTIRPIGRMEFDGDVVCLLKAVSRTVGPGKVKAALGQRLREHGFYAGILEEKKRCWRLDYAGDFHLDVSPTIANELCFQGGELVPDKALADWHPTNPSGFRDLFRRRAALKPRLLGRSFANARDGSAEPFPSSVTLGAILHRIVQLLKRHRDEYFLHVKEEIAPISVIITTLAMRAYEQCVASQVFVDELDVVIETIRLMPYFIERIEVDRRLHYAIWNETTRGENFAERWNSEPNRAQAFFRWHATAFADFEALRDAVGMDVVRRQLTAALGDRIANRVMDRRIDAISQARRAGGLYAAPAIGLTTAPAAGATPVRPNDFFGD